MMKNALFTRLIIGVALFTGATIFAQATDNTVLTEISPHVITHKYVQLHQSQQDEADIESERETKELDTISVSTPLNNNDDNVMFINTGNIEVTLPPDVPGHTIYFKRMSGGVRLTGGRILPAPGGKEMSSIDLDYASGFVKCMGNYWVMFYCG